MISPNFKDKTKFTSSKEHDVCVNSEADNDIDILADVSVPNLFDDNIVTLSDSSIESVVTLNTLPNPYIRSIIHNSESEESSQIGISPTKIKCYSADRNMKENNDDLEKIILSHSDDEVSILAEIQNPNVFMKNKVASYVNNMSSVASLNKLSNPFIGVYSSDNDSGTERRISNRIQGQKNGDVLSNLNMKLDSSNTNSSLIVSPIRLSTKGLKKKGKFVAHTDLSNGNTLTKKNPSLKKWTPEMIAFYDTDEPGMLNLTDVLGKMSHDKTKWKVSPDDYKKSKRQSFWNRCSICRQYDHTSINCSKAQHCIYCSSPNHIDTRMCPSRCCLNCGQRPHNYCPMMNKKCVNCNQFGHDNQTCPNHWRQFHITTSGKDPVRPQTRPSVGEKKMPYCCNCGNAGHYGFECLIPAKFHILSQFVSEYYSPPMTKLKYTPEYEIDDDAPPLKIGKYLNNSNPPLSNCLKKGKNRIEKDRKRRKANKMRRKKLRAKNMVQL